MSKAKPAETNPPVEEPTPAPRLDQHKATRRLRRGLISMAVLVAMIVGLLFAIPGLRGVGDLVADMDPLLLVLAVVLEILSCVSYIVCFLQVFEGVPWRFGARVAMSELAFGAAVPLGGAGSVAVGALLMVERGAPTRRVAERSAVLFLLTSAINVLTLAGAGFAAWLGILPGKQNVLLTLVPGAVSAVLFFGFLLLPVVTVRILAVTARRSPDGVAEVGRLGRWALALSDTIRATADLLFTPDWRLLGAVGFLWFDIAVLAACFWATGHTPPLSTIVLAYQIGYLSNLIPIPGGAGVLDGSFVGLFVLYGVNATTAASATLVYHLICVWVPAIWGTISFLLLQRDRSPIDFYLSLEELREFGTARRMFQEATRR